MILVPDVFQKITGNPFYKMYNDTFELVKKFFIDTVKLFYFIVCKMHGGCDNSS